MNRQVKQFLKSILSVLHLLGIDPFKVFATLRGLPFYLADLRELKKQRLTSVKPFAFGAFSPYLHERFDESGCAEGAYFHQDLLVARRIFANSPAVHVDVGSRVDGFVAHVAAFRPIEVIDIRPLSNTVTNIRFLQADLMSVIDPKLENYCDSLSCLHALEHFGLGRYGDPVKYDGYLIGLDNLWKIVKPGGKFYFSVPIGPQRIEFNAHRVFSVAYLLELFAGKFRVDHFSFVEDKGVLHEDVALSDEGLANEFGCFYGCGIFELTKL